MKTHQSCLSLLLAITFSPLAIADLAIIESAGNAKLYLRMGDRIHTAQCTPYADLGNSVASARGVCKTPLHSLHTEYMTAEILKNSPDSVFYSAKDILSPEALENIKNSITAKETEIKIIEKRREQFGDASVDLVRLQLLKTEVKNLSGAVSRHQTQSQAKSDYLEQRIRLFAAVNDSDRLQVKTPDTFESQFLTAFKIDFDKYTKMPCGIAGTLIERTQECSKVNEPFQSNHLLVMRTEKEKIWFNISTKKFYSAQSEAISTDPKFLFEITSQLWRRASREEALIGPLATVYISAQPLNPGAIAPYTGRVTQKNGKRAVRFDFNAGILTFTLIEGQKESTLKQISVIHSPTQYAAKNSIVDPRQAGSDHPFFETSVAFTESFIGLNEWYFEGEQLFLFIFPGLLGIPTDIAYASVGYPIAFATDLVRNGAFGVANAFNFTLGRNHVSKVANKKFKALVSGNTNATASKRVMRELIEGIQNLKI